MALPTCDHLDLYGAQYLRTEASYRHVVDVLERLMNDGPSAELVTLAGQALQEWSAEDGKLREMLVEEVRAGKVRVPRGLLARAGVTARKARRDALRLGQPVCTVCRQPVPRLAYPEWGFAHNGMATFRGVEFPPYVAAPV